MCFGEFGFGSSIGDAKFDLEVGHPIILNEDKQAEQIGVLTLSLASRRLASQLYLSHGLPGRLAGLLGPVEGPQVLAWLVDVYSAWLKVKERPERSWQKIIARSPFNLVVVDKAP